MILWSISPPSSWFVGVLNEIVFLALTAHLSIIGLSWGEQYWLSLGNTFCWLQPDPCCLGSLGSSWPWLGDIKVAICPEDLPSKISQSTISCPITWQMEQGVWQLGALNTLHGRVSRSGMYSQEVYFLSFWVFFFLWNKPVCFVE